MSDEQFLLRWSRRKQDAKADHAERAGEEAAEAHAPAPSAPAVAEPAPLEFDLSGLPSIESIDAATDVTAFLRKGIPQELSRAALRRAWSSDPAIRDFVGLAENAWDFNDPSAMAGFGPLDYSAEQVEALVRRIVGSVMRTDENLPNPPAEAGEESARPAHEGRGFASNSVTAAPDLRSIDESATAELSSDSAASHPPAAGEEASLPRRTHGGALPQ
jgi:hypothetical protein